MINEWIDSYYNTAKFAGIRTNPFAVVMLGLFMGGALFLLASMYDFVLGFLLFILCLDLSIGMPFLLADRKITQIESRLPDVLHHIGTTLKTGSTVEVALKEVTITDYGPITAFVREMLDRINKGKSFEQAFSEFAKDSRSDLIDKVSIIIVAARRSGGSLLQTLNFMAEDIRAMSRLKRERKTKTMMQFMFIIVASCLIAPFIFGILRSVLSILFTLGMPGESPLLKDFDLTFKLYLLLEASLSVVGAVMIREGKASKSILYIPIALLAVYIIYMGVSNFFLPLIGG